MKLGDLIILTEYYRNEFKLISKEANGIGRISSVITGSEIGFSDTINVNFPDKPGLLQLSIENEGLDFINITKRVDDMIEVCAKM